MRKRESKNRTIIEWFVFGRVGVSSKTMAAVISGALTKENLEGFCHDIPHDWDDFSRCYKFYVDCNISKTQLQLIPEILPYWRPIIDNWDLLKDTYEQEKPFSEIFNPIRDRCENLRYVRH